MASAKKDFFDMDEPAQGVFELARKMLADHGREGMTHFDHERLRKDTEAMIKAGYEAKQKLYDPDIPKDKFDKEDLAEVTYDGMRYKTAEALLEKATAMMMQRKKLREQNPDAPEGEADPKILIEAELGQLFSRIFEGWRPSPAGEGMVEKVFSGRVKGPETLGFLMQIYTVANHGGPGAVGAEEWARNIDVRHGKNSTDQERTKVIVPAAIIKMALENEVQRGL